MMWIKRGSRRMTLHGMIAIMAPFAIVASGAPATAHDPYVLPALFDATTRTRITVEASFTENAFRPEVAMKDAPFEITGPDGRTTRLADPILAEDRTIAAADLPVDGLYRLSSGQRLGRIGTMFRTGDGWTMVGEGAAAPAGATVVPVRSATLADAYVLRGKPSARGALAIRGRALEIHPLGDPASYAPGAAMAFEMLYEGRPLAGASVSLLREAGYYDGNRQVATVVTDAAGRASLTAPDAGRYLMLVRHRTATPAAADAYTSFTATLALEAM